MSLFSDLPPNRVDNRSAAPLADRMRPRSLDEVLGQDALLGAGSPVRLAVEAKSVPSLILWGPPGVGKTTIARLLAADAGYRFVSFSAVTSGVKEIRECVSEARNTQRRGERTLVFIDEIHRFSKSQQDALLPHVEEGLFTLVGATTENPSFEVNAALLSRCRVVTLEALGHGALEGILRAAVDDSERGLGPGIEVTADAIDAVVAVAAGDGRRALNLLELTATTVRAGAKGERAGTGDPAVRMAAEDVKKIARGSPLLYDKSGDQHYDLASAFIKSMRASDPDASIYWLARMLEAGEDPLFVARRIVIFAAEDVGNADPRGLSVAVAAKEAAHFVGMPEAKLPLAQAVLYLATAPKSNTALAAYGAASEDVHRHGSLPAPFEIRNAPTALMKEMGYGAGYRYPHDSGGVSDQECLPEKIASRRYFASSRNGYEKTISERIEGWEAERTRRRGEDGGS